MTLGCTLPQDRMPEAEVSLRLAFHLLSLPGAQGDALVAIVGKREVKKALRKTLFKYQLHKDEGLFDRA
jgi:hypothetical protein